MSFGRANYIKKIRNVGQQRTKTHHTLSFFTRPFLSKMAKLGGMLFDYKCVYGDLSIYYEFALREFVLFCPATILFCFAQRIFCFVLLSDYFALFCSVTILLCFAQ